MKRILKAIIFVYVNINFFCSCNSDSAIVFKQYDMNSEQEFVEHIKNVKWYNASKEELKKNCILVYPKNVDLYMMTGLSEYDDDFVWNDSYVTLRGIGTINGIDYSCCFYFTDSYCETEYELVIDEAEKFFCSYTFMLNDEKNLR
ncbi:MAG: hypothetical protein L6U99_07890 [Clostridium sp.]|nr:MAG: hypothetical protein L6U99_07890 [Clostridium sp.]